ncbi:protein PRRC1 [Agrilus planipennis]|uniref:Protein PRRC1 n=1 Tax=Agrilus planipennis TaxID=224129 RepID=A0A1W4XE74_AGRPL|nr:protein PRRC1 [Agrilus planipennis]
MLQEDSNGDASFEIIEKNVTEKAAPVVNNSASSGNLLSNVPPPLVLPSFFQTPILPSITTSAASQVQVAIASSATSLTQTNTKQPTVLLVDNSPKVSNNRFCPTEFSAAIPPTKGIQHGIPESSTYSSITTDSVTESNSNTLDTFSKEEESVGILGWVKGAVSNGGIFYKVAEKAKSSVDSVITTLDPQMREYIYSGGDLDILVASTQEDKISAVREAFQSVFGKATVEGVSVKVTNVAVQPIGFEEGLKGADERIQYVYKDPKIQPVPVVAVEGFIVKFEDDRWYELAVVLLKDPIRQLSLHTYTQMTPIPSEIVALAQESTPQDYPLRETGLSVTIGSIMAENLGVNHNKWHHALTGVHRREMILLAGKAIANLYRNCSMVNLELLGSKAINFN